MNELKEEDNSGVEWLESVSVKDLCHLRHTLQENVILRGLFCLYGSWNKDLKSSEAILKHWRPSVSSPHRKLIAGMVQVDESDENLEAFCGDNNATLRLNCCDPLPDELPALLAVVQYTSSTSSIETRAQIVSGVSASDMLHEGASPRVMKSIKATFNSLILGICYAPPNDRKRKIRMQKEHQDALRIFVAGDRANVGKTSVCLGLLGSLVAMGYEPASIAYIKPATQDESKQLLQVYCEKVGIQCVPIGPIVFYKGFTRAFLAGEAESSAEMLQKVASAIDGLSARKRIVVIDGVGYPAVGSICGVDNASVAMACGYSERNPLGVLLVSPSGVGHAVDSFNLNANYFDSKFVPVMGAIFNKLPSEGYYSLANCREQVSSYFQQYQSTRKAFGFLPYFPNLGGDDAIDHLDDFFRIFADHVDVASILESAQRIQSTKPAATSPILAPAKKTKLQPAHTDVHHHHYLSHSGTHATPARATTNGSAILLSRQQIEEQAKAAGAKDSC